MRYALDVRRLGLLTLVLAAGCRGTVPNLNSPPEQGIASVLIGCRMTLPTGDTPSGRVALNLEGEGGGETYRLPVRPGQTLLYQVEPGFYKLTPTRSLFGFHQAQLKVVVAGHSYKVPFPREILRKAVLDVKPTKIVPIGIIDVTLTGRMPGRPASVKVTLDDSVQARRDLVQREVHLMMDVNAPADDRSAALAWTRGLEQALSELLTEADRRPSFRSSP